MNHLTNLYKYKCEQLQEHINNLKTMLNEANAPLPTQGNPSLVPPSGIDPGMFDPSIQPPITNPYQQPMYYGPTPPANPAPGTLWQNQYGRIYQWQNGQWRFVRGNQFDDEQGYHRGRGYGRAWP
jgi:hypothetical protein